MIYRYLNQRIHMELLQNIQRHDRDDCVKRYYQQTPDVRLRILANGRSHCGYLQVMWIYGLFLFLK